MVENITKLSRVPKGEYFKATILATEGPVEVLAKAGKVAVDSESGQKWRVVHVGFRNQRLISALPVDTEVKHTGKPSRLALDLSAAYSGIRADGGITEPVIHLSRKPSMRGTLVPGVR